MPAPPIPAAAPRIAGDRYAVVSRIGEGGMSTVYRAYDTKLGVWRAVKMLHPQHSRRARLRTRFESEARTMARLEHPNLVRIYDVGVEGKLPFMVMEIVLGGSLQDWSERHGAMRVAMALQATRQVLLGLEVCHGAGIVHRDVKPHNVLVAPPGICKLTDFGIAQIQDDARTKTGSVLGTQGYMAPEQRLDAKTVDHRADLYGVGAMLWSLLTGRIAQDLYNFAKTPKLAIGIDPVALPVLSNALTYGREERYQDAASMRADVEAALEELGSTGREVNELSEDVTRSEKFDPTVMKELAQILVDGRTTEDAPDEHHTDLRSSAPSAQPPPTIGPPGKVLPYYMPPKGEPQRREPMRPREPAEDEGLPDWIDRDSLPDPPAAKATQQPHVIGLDGAPGAKLVTPLPPPRATPLAEEHRQPEPRPAVSSPPAAATPPERRKSVPPPAQPPAAPAPPAQELSEEGTDPGTRLLSAAMVPIVAAMGVAVLGALGLVILVNLSTQRVESAERHAEDTRVVLHEALRQEHDLTRQLGELGADRTQLDALYLGWTETHGEPARTEAAIRFLDLCESEGRRWVEDNGGMPAQVQATHSLRRLRSARGGYEDAVQDWQRAVTGPMGWLATHVGGAEPPP